MSKQPLKIKSEINKTWIKMIRNDLNMCNFAEEIALTKWNGETEELM